MLNDNARSGDVGVAALSRQEHLGAGVSGPAGAAPSDPV
jgi:hypothetical protein